MISFSVSDIEFEDDMILDLVEKSKARGARKVGFQTKTEATKSIIDNPRPSVPGSPPNSHTGILRRFIRYDYDPSVSAVVAGPVLLQRRSKDAAVAMEKGGNSQTTRGRTIRVAARPFMSPAFADVLSNSVPEVFENTFHQ